MERIPSKNRKRANLVGKLIVIHSFCSMLAIWTLFVVAGCMSAFYIHALYEGLGLDVPLKNINWEKSCILFQELIPLQLGNDFINLRDVRNLIMGLYLAVAVLTVLIIPQAFGGKFLLQATKLKMEPAQSYHLTSLYQIVQGLICFIEILSMVILNICLMIWPGIQCNGMLIGCLYVLLLIVARMRFMKISGAFLQELGDEIDWADMDEESAPWKSKFDLIGQKKWQIFEEDEEEVKYSSWNVKHTFHQLANLFNMYK